jgi:chromosomal replication initiation ATPase DnaA
MRKVKNQQLYFNFETNKFEADNEYNILINNFNLQAFNFLFKNKEWLINSVFIFGEIGVGKSTLCKTFLNKNNGFLIDPKKINILEASKKIKEYECFLIEDIQDLSLDDEEFIFHFFNELKSHNKKLLLTSNTSPKDIDFSLPDLKSRILGSEIIKIEQPDDNSLKTIFVKIISQKQLALSKDVINYIFIRAQRSMKNLIEIANALETLAMSENKNISIPLIKERLNLDN